MSANNLIIIKETKPNKFKIYESDMDCGGESFTETASSLRDAIKKAYEIWDKVEIVEYGLSFDLIGYKDESVKE